MAIWTRSSSRRLSLIIFSPSRAWSFPTRTIIVAIDKTDPAKIQIKEYDGTAGDIIAGVIKESAVAGENSVIVKRGKLNIEAIDTSNISGLEDYEVFEMLEHQNLFVEKTSERQEF